MPFAYEQAQYFDKGSGYIGRWNMQSESQFRNIYVDIENMRRMNTWNSKLRSQRKQMQSLFCFRWIIRLFQ